MVASKKSRPPYGIQLILAVSLTLVVVVSRDGRLLSSLPSQTMNKFFLSATKTKEMIKVHETEEAMLKQSLENKLPFWVQFFVGPNFQRYRALIEDKMKRHRQTRAQIMMKNMTIWEMPRYGGEFGFELALMPGWAYNMQQSQKRTVFTNGVQGTKYLYYFSDNHTTEVERKRNAWLNSFPDGNPFGLRTAHFNITMFPKDPAWQPPPYKAFFQQPHAKDVLDIREGKPLVVILNKYSKEWGRPTNFFPLPLLDELLQYLTPKYTVLYKQYSPPAFDEAVLGTPRKKKWKDYNDKEMIREKFPNVVLFEDIVAASGDEIISDADDLNLLQFALFSISDRFLSVQGGVSVLASFFGGTSVIYARKGQELTKGDYTYYHKFSNASVHYQFPNGSEPVHYDYAVEEAVVSDWFLDKVKNQM